MARSFRYFLFACGVLTTLVVMGIAQSSWSQDTEKPAAPAAKQPEIPEIKDAIEAFKIQDIPKTEELLEKAYKAHTDILPPPPIILAQFFAQANQGGFMRVALEKAVLKYGDDPESYVIMGNIALQERRVTEADLLYSKAKGLLPKLASVKRKEVLDPQTVSGLAAVAEAREKWPEAESYLNKLLELIPNKDEAKSARAQAMLRVARSLFQQSKPAESLERLRAAYALDPQNILTPEAALGGFYQQFPDPVNATRWMGIAIKQKPDDLRTRLVVGQWALETGKTDEAQTHADKALQIEPKSVQAMVLRGVVALFKKDFAAAEKHFENAHLRSPGLFAATNNLALALCEQTDEGGAKKRKAFEYAQKNYMENQKSAEAASTLGWVFYKLGDLDKAERAIFAAAQAGNMSPDTAYYLAQILFERGRKPEAKNIVAGILKKDVNGNDRPFSMRPEAQKLYDKLKDDPAAVAKPATTTPKKDSK